MAFLRLGWVVAVLMLGVSVVAAPTTVEAKKGRGGSEKSERIYATLKGSSPYTSAKGKAKFEVKKGESKFEVEIEKVKSLSGTTLQVFVDSANIGSLTINTFGRAELELESEDGDIVPAVVSGSVVELRTDTSAVVASGSFK